MTNLFVVTEVYVRGGEDWKLASLSFTRLITTDVDGLVGAAAARVNIPSSDGSAVWVRRAVRGCAAQAVG